MSISLGWSENKKFLRIYKLYRKEISKIFGNLGAISF